MSVGSMVSRLLPMLIAGCAPIPPLYSPLATTGYYGYADEPLGPTRIKVLYKAPRGATFAISTYQQDADAERRIALAYDMAIWRASELAIASGYPAFTITDRLNNVNVDVRYNFAGDLFYNPCYGAVTGYRFGCTPAPFPTAFDRYAWADAMVTLTIELQPEIRPGAFDAANTISELRAQYPTALLAGQALR